MADAYALFVEIQGMSEELFWHADVSLVNDIASNCAEYRAWRDYAIERESKKKGR